MPHIKIGELIAAAVKHQNAFGDEIRAKIEELKDVAVAEYEKTRNKKKDPELDRATIKVRLTDEILYKIIKLQMDTAACKNKGFILDGYPRNITDAKNIFLEKSADESEENPFPGHSVNKDILPQYVIVLQGEDAQLKQKVKDLPIEKTSGTHFTEPHMDRRLKVYREQNVHDSGASVQCFFSKAITIANDNEPAKDNIKIVDVFSENEFELLSTLQHFIERKGKPCCLNLITDRDNKFLKNLEKKQGKPAEEVDASLEVEEQDEISVILEREEEENRRRVDWEKEKKVKDAEEAEKRRIKEVQDMTKAELIKQQERDLLDTRSQPIRQYLMDNLVPYLTQGLIDLCKKVPQDPVDSLADFLLAKADEIDAKKLKDREAALKAKLDAKKSKH